MSFLSSWLCTNNTKNMLVKIVHPGGHVELHDRPVLASEIMLRNPRYCVAHRHVFRDPWAIVSPDTTLMPGQKFYAVPISTIRKLQRQSSKYSPSPVQQSRTNPCSKDEIIEDDDDGINSCSKDETLQDHHDHDHGRVSACWLFMSKSTTPKLQNANNTLKSLDSNYSK